MFNNLAVESAVNVNKEWDKMYLSFWKKLISETWFM
jgi:hypothetical protein